MVSSLLTTITQMVRYSGRPLGQCRSYASNTQLRRLASGPSGIESAARSAARQGNVAADLVRIAPCHVAKSRARGGGKRAKAVPLGQQVD